MTKALAVWWDEAVAGTLAVDPHGDMLFTYAAGWLADDAKLPLSFSLPKRAEPFGRRECRPFFEGLLPEESQREAVARALGISRGNAFQLLDALGGDVAGALALWPEGETPPPAPLPAAQATALDDAQILHLLETLPRRPFLAGGEGGLRLSLAGAQSKLPVVLAGGAVALPAPGQPTTHILKPPIARFPLTTENEAFAMRLAARMGLSAAPVEARVAAGRPFLLVERYDRRAAPGGAVRRLHQEDFCQALGILPENKYASEGGPGFADCFNLVRRACSRPAIEVLKLLDAAVAQVILGNADAHGKNYSLLYQDGTVTLSPLYDLLCTVAYPELSPKFAMKVAKRATLEDLRPGDWDTFARDTGFAAPFVRRRVKELSALAQQHARTVADELTAPGLSGDVLAALAARIADRARRLARTV